MLSFTRFVKLVMVLLLLGYSLKAKTDESESQQESVSFVAATFLFACEESPQGPQCSPMDQGQLQSFQVVLQAEKENYTGSFQLVNKTAGITSLWSAWINKEVSEQGILYRLNLSSAINDYNGAANNVGFSSVEYPQVVGSLQTMSYAGPMFKKGGKTYLNYAVMAPRSAQVMDKLLAPQQIIFKNSQVILNH